MIVGVYACLDLKSGAYMAPFTLHNDAMAVRAFSDAVLSTESMVSKHPEDFVLHKLGTFDDGNGELVSCNPVPLCKAIDFVKGDK